MQTSLGGAIGFSFWFSSWSRNGNKLVSVKAANKTEGEQSGACCRAGCACPPGDTQSHSPVRMVAHHWHSTLFSLKTGSGVGSEVSPILCILPLWCWGGIPKEAPSSLALADDPTSGDGWVQKGQWGPGWRLWGFLLTFRTVTHMHK